MGNHPRTSKADGVDLVDEAHVGYWSILTIFRSGDTRSADQSGTFEGTNNS